MGYSNAGRHNPFHSTLPEEKSGGMMSGGQYWVPIKICVTRDKIFLKNDDGCRRLANWNILPIPEASKSWNLNLKQEKIL